jgi:hypothetical protein
MEDATMPQVTIEVPERVLEVMKKHDMTPEEVFEYGFELMSSEIPNEETLQAMEQSERGEGIYTAKDENDFYESLGLDKWRRP